MGTNKSEKKKLTSMITQVALLFIAGVILIGALSSLASYTMTSRTFRDDQKSRAISIASDLQGYIYHYPAHEWLLCYWYEHYDILDIEYEADYTQDSLTLQKCRILEERHPGFMLEYATTDEVEALPAEDQKLYAEIVYSWLITRIDQMEKYYDLSYLFCVVTEEPYDSQFFLFIAAKEGAVRGNEFGQTYPIGKVLQATDKQQAAMRAAAMGEPQTGTNEDGKYIDHYYSIGSFKGHDFLIGQSNYYKKLARVINGQAMKHSFMTMGFLAAVAVVCLLMILFYVLQPLKKVQQSIRLYKDTKDCGTVVNGLSKIRSHNELAQLSNDVSDLAKEIDDYTNKIEKITSERERIETELALASRIQTAMLPQEFPPYPDRKDFDIRASMTPAREVGGDFYDFFLIDDSHLCLVIADVSGKGVPAALYMMAAKITLSHNIKMGKSPAQILTDANTAICSHNREEMFITVWLGILDLETGRLTAANAGHEYPILMDPGEQYRLIKDKHFFVLGGMEGMEYQEYELQMRPGSKLFLYTDGLVEAVNAQNEMFGTDRILEILNSNRIASPETVLENMKTAVEGYVLDMEQFDDLTMLCLSYNGPGL